MAADLTALLADLAAEGDALDALVANLPEAGWARSTPAEGWTIAHQIGHLAWTDEVATLSATDPASFQALLAEALPRALTFVDEAAAHQAARPPAELLTGWRAGRAALQRTLAAVPPQAKLPWFGTQMSATSMTTGRLMETWAHGQDVADALGLARAATDRLRHIAHIAVRARDYAYALHGRPVPGEPFRVEITSPSGELWTWGPQDAAQRVSGPALDFALLVTQRRHRDDVDVRAQGADADEWLSIAQAFAGPPGKGRPAGAFA